MHITELKNLPISRSLAYVLGLVFPLYKTVYLMGHEYVVGPVNHNPGRVTQSELNEHFRSVFDLLQDDSNTSKIELKTNKCAQYSISAKTGFSVLINKDGISDDETLEILSQKVSEIKNASDDIKKEYIKGCFDGRSSWDTTMLCLSIDVDRSYTRQDLTIDIIESQGIYLNINRRAKNHSKNDQLRIKKNSIRSFVANVGMYSTCRQNIINKALNILD